MTQFGLDLRQAPPDTFHTLIFAPDIANATPTFVDLSWIAQEPPADPPWHLIFYLAGPHSNGRCPSIKLAKQSAIAAEGEGAVRLDVILPGYYTIFWLPVSDQGISLPGGHMRVLVP
jgi:hypothetical protein